jgi:hypothetical protein
VTQADANKVYAQIVAKAWADPAFKAKLLADPMTALKEAGHTVPEGLVVKTVENTDKLVYLVVPAKPKELSDAQLDAMAGGITAGDILPGLPPDLIGKF